MNIIKFQIFTPTVCTPFSSPTSSSDQLSHSIASLLRTTTSFFHFILVGLCFTLLVFTLNSLTEFLGICRHISYICPAEPQLAEMHRLPSSSLTTAVLSGSSRPLFALSKFLNDAGETNPANIPSLLHIR